VLNLISALPEDVIALSSMTDGMVADPNTFEYADEMDQNKILQCDNH